MKIGWDLDGTLLKDDGNYERTTVQLTPLFRLLENMQDHYNVCINGRESVPDVLIPYFNKIITREWKPINWDEYYGYYFMWKSKLFLLEKLDLIFEDDQNLTRFLTEKGQNVIWTPQYQFNGDRKK